MRAAHNLKGHRAVSLLIAYDSERTGSRVLQSLRSQRQMHKLACPLVFGLARQFMSSYRMAILSLIVFFFAGLVLLSIVNVRKAALEAGNEAPAKA